MLSKPDTKFPDRPGIYFFKRGPVILYIGKALNLKQRLNSYFDALVSEKTRQMVSEAYKIEYIETGSEFEALLLEANYIKKFRPHYNIALKDDKNFLYIFVSTLEIYPKVFLTRKPKINAEGNYPDTCEGLRGKYIGPYPSTRIVRKLIAHLRKIFPYCQQKRNNKPCFYSHMRLCDPCPGLIENINSIGLKKKLTRLYRKNLFYLVRVLEGNMILVEKALEREMKTLSREQNYEEAVIRRNQLRALHISYTQQRIAAFMENENFYFDSQRNLSNKLRQLLLPFFPMIPELTKIECYDISHITGKFTVGSMTVFVHAIPEKSLYRRFKIQSLLKSDVSSLAEMIQRRLTHTEWELPQLMLIDGGKPQVSIISRLLVNNSIKIAVIGLAKKWEELVIPLSTGFQQIRLSRNQIILKFLQQMRDETHRFGLKYHRLLRKKAF